MPLAEALRRGRRRPPRIVNRRPATPERTFQNAQAEIFKLRRQARKRAHDDQGERERIKDAEKCAAADLTEIKRQRYHGDRDQRRIMREAAQAILKRATASTAWEPLRRFRPPKPYEP